MSAINLDNISFSYSSVPLLDHISLHVGDGERAAFRLLKNPTERSKTISILHLVRCELLLPSFMLPLPDWRAILLLVR